MALVVVGVALHLAGPYRQHRLRPNERLDLGLLVDREHTSARSGGARYSPTTSRTFSMNSGSVLSLNVPLRWGCSPKARHIRLMELWLKPVAAAIERVLQWVASRGVDSRVRAMIRSTSASAIVRGAPGRGSSSSPSGPCSPYRRRHLPTVWVLTARSAAMASFEPPSAAARTIRARRASACPVFGRLVQRVNVSRSCVVSVSSVSGRPLGMASSRSV